MRSQLAQPAARCVVSKPSVKVRAEEDGLTPAIVERIRIKDGYMVEGRKDGVVGAWTC